MTIGAAHILQGDARRIPLASGSVQNVVTSPPYWGLRDYGVAGQIGLEQSPADYVADMVAVFSEVRRVLRDDGTVFMNLGDSYQNAKGQAGGVDPKQPARRHGLRPQDISVPGLKPKDLVGIPWSVAFALRADGWWLRDCIIWCLSPSTIIYAKTATTEGPATVHDLVRLDPQTVKLWTGKKWSRVTHWRGTRACSPLKITLRSGEIISCTPEHEWPLTNGKLVKAGDLHTGDVLATCTLPAPTAAFDMPADLAWFAGLYMAEGSLSGNAIQIAGHTKELNRHARLKEIVTRFGGTYVYRSSGNTAAIVVHGEVLHGTIRHFITGKRANGKHLHSRCWTLPNAVLSEFLMGYLAGDGHWDEKNDRWRLGFCANHAWANDLRCIAARLGSSLTLNPGYAKIGRTRKFESYRGELRFVRSDHHNSKPRTEIIHIGTASEGLYYDIGIQDEPHLFALASGVLTHNCKPNCMPSSVTDRTTTSHEYIFLLTKKAHYYYDADAIREPITSSGGACFGPQTKVGVTRTEDGGHAKIDGGGSMVQSRRLDDPSQRNNPLGRNKRSVWTIPTNSFPDAHFATFPVALPELCIKAGTSARGCCPACGAPWKRIVERVPTGVMQKMCDGWDTGDGAHGTIHRSGREKGQAGIPVMKNVTINWLPSCKCAADDPVPCRVFDPFSGSGTTIMVARDLGRIGIGMDLKPDYNAIAQRRLALPKKLKRASRPKAKENPAQLTLLGLEVA